ncbi:UDP-glucose dehydrogenase family protein [Brevibacillus sp. B_LB10_24]|uniref:UDP-glucose dehydrogenase family protein n=1 Tax=Brevibacillus sp. B_LB10_24 TaxID=3380645 RepID=UPI0038BB8A28
MKVIIIGCGYVGLSTGIVLAYIGHEVTLIDRDEEKIAKLRAGELPIYEHGLQEVLRASAGRISFTDDWDSFDTNADAVVIAVGTPIGEGGGVDLTYVRAAVKEIGARVNGNLPVILLKSTVPPGTGREMRALLQQKLAERGMKSKVTLISNPEFLREGQALFDSFYPDRIVAGIDSHEEEAFLTALYQPVLLQDFIPPHGIPRPGNDRLPALFATDLTSAELIKYAANAFLAVKISFINEFANLAESVGADITAVARGIGLDQRIGPQFLQAGIGWGGSCFGKDMRAILHAGKRHQSELPIVRAALEVNQTQRELVAKKLQAKLNSLAGRTIGLLGLAFKPGTDDLRDAPSLDIIRQLVGGGARVKVYDPAAMERLACEHSTLDVECCPTAESLFEGCDAVVLVTEWEEFLHLPYAELGERMREKLLVDGRNVLDQKMLTDAGFTVCSVGRSDTGGGREWLGAVYK